jgi:hypothetical protein
MDMKPIGIEISPNAGMAPAARKEKECAPDAPSESFQASEGVERSSLISPTPVKSPGEAVLSCPAAGSQAAGKEHEALAILRRASKTDAEAAQDIAWLKNHAPQGADLADMAEFYALGKGIYHPGNARKEELLKESLQGIDEFLKSTWGFMASLTAAEKKECLKILLEAIPPKQHWVMHNGDTLRPLGYIYEHTHNPKTEKAGFCWGYDHMSTTFSPPPGPDMSIVEATREFAKFLDIITHAEGRKSSELDTNDDTSAFHAVQIMRNVFHYDAEKTDRLKSLMGTLGDPWHALGIIQRLDDIHPAHRDEAEKAIIKDLRALRDKNGELKPNDIATTTDNLWFPYSLMQPQEKYSTFKGQLERIGNDLAASYPPQGGRWGLWEAHQLKERIRMTGKYREQGETVMSSEKRYKDFVDDLAGLKIGHEAADSLYDLAGKEKGRFLEAIPSSKTCADISDEIKEIIHQSPLTPDVTPDLIKLGLEKRKPDEPLRDACRRLAFDYQLLGDFDMRDRLREMAEKEIKAGGFPGESIDTIMPELEHRIDMRRIHGDSPEEAVKRALEDARSERQPVQSVSNEIESFDDCLMIGGLKLKVNQS